MKRRITAFIAGRIVEAFAHGEGVTELAFRFRISKQRAEDIVRRHGRRERYGRVIAFR